MTTPRRPGHGGGTGPGDGGTGPGGGGTGPGGGGTGPGGGEPGGHHSPWFRAANLPEQPGPPEQAAPPDRTARIEPAEPARPRPRAERGGPERDGARGRLPGPLPPEAPPPRSSHPETPATGGRAERRRAAKARGRRGAGHRAAPGGGSSAGRHSAAQGAPGAGGPSAGAGGRPLTRVEARRAARARKDSVGVVASRVVGELFITFGVVMLLFVTYQLWWTNVRAGIQADQAKKGIENAWAEGRKPGAFEPGQGFAIMYLPTLDVVVPIAEGIDKERVLDRGMVGHYAEGRLRTAMPSDRQGNFAVAGHRNTHGEPFRYINRLRPGDPIVVETQDTYYTYEMASILPQTEPSNVSVIDPVPAGSGFTGPGRYLTLTTCTPEFTSTYRMIVWGKMVEERPRSKGKPDALVS